MGISYSAGCINRISIEKDAAPMAMKTEPPKFQKSEDSGLMIPRIFDTMIFNDELGGCCERVETASSFNCCLSFCICNSSVFLHALLLFSYLYASSDLLELRLEFLAGLVDYHIIVEVGEAHQSFFFISLSVLEI